MFFLRGFPASGDIFIDGVRDLGEYNRDLFATESVEVLKGSSALMFGRGSTGGLINQTTKVADLLPTAARSASRSARSTRSAPRPTSTSAPANRARCGWSRWPRTRAATAIRRTSRSTASRRASASASARRRDLTLLLLLPARPRTSPTTASRRCSAAAPASSALPPVSPRNYYGYANHDYAQHETNIATLRLDHQLQRRCRLRNTLRWAKYKRQSEATIADAATRPTSTARRSPRHAARLLRVTRNHDTGRTRTTTTTRSSTRPSSCGRLRPARCKHTRAGRAGARARAAGPRELRARRQSRPRPAIQAPTSITSLPQSPIRPPSSRTPRRRTCAQRPKGDTWRSTCRTRCEFSPEWKALLGMRWEHYDAERAADTALGAGAASHAGPFAAHRQHVERPRGPDLAADAAPVVLRLVGQLLQPVGRARRLRRHRRPTSTRSTRTSSRRRTENYEIGAQWDFATACKSARRALPQREDQRADGRPIPARRCSPASAASTASSSSRRDRSRRTGTSTAASRSWTARSSAGPANVQGNTPLGVARWSGSVWTRLPARRRLGDRRRRCAARRARGSPTRTSRLADPGVRRAGRDGRLRAAEVRACGSTSTT